MLFYGYPVELIADWSAVSRHTAYLLQDRCPQTVQAGPEAVRTESRRSRPRWHLERLGHTSPQGRRPRP